MRGAAIHVLGDLLGSVAALIAGAVILFTGWTPIDPLLSLAVAFIIVRSGWQVVAEQARASYDDGILQVEVPLAEPDATARRVPIEGGPDE